MRPLVGCRLICVFGCGGDRDKSKRPAMARAACAHADLAIATSDNPRSEDPLAILAMVRAGLARTGVRHAQVFGGRVEEHDEQ